MAVKGTSGKCNRWFFKFNGNECSGPMTIEAVVYNHWPSGSPNLLHHRSLEGYCENILQGRVTVELWVGQCPSGHILGDAYSGYQSISQIMIEEVSRAQSWLARSSSPEGKSRIFAFLFGSIILDFIIFSYFPYHPKIEVTLCHKYFFAPIMFNVTRFPFFQFKPSVSF